MRFTLSCLYPRLQLSILKQVGVHHIDLFLFVLSSPVLPLVFCRSNSGWIMMGMELYINGPTRNAFVTASDLVDFVENVYNVGWDFTDS
jgi:hypothetical protein